MQFIIKYIKHINLYYTYTVYTVVSRYRVLRYIGISSETFNSWNIEKRVELQILQCIRIND